MANSYIAIMVRKKIDRFGHHGFFADEMSVAFSEERIDVQVIDYLEEPKAVVAAARDAGCRALLCFNGFGSEVRCPTGGGRLAPLFDLCGKPLIDIMHDCPVHETMAHQIESLSRHRHLFITDFSYAALARQVGIRNVWFAPSITFPATLGAMAKPWLSRSIEILLPIGLQDPEHSASRLTGDQGFKNNAFRLIFNAVVERSLADLRSEPIDELRSLATAIDMRLDFRRPDDRFLLSTIVDYVKFQRRRRLLHVIRDLPITVMTDRLIELPGKLKSVPNRSAKELLHTMADSKAVICPTPHLAGYHERPLCAFTAGAAVFSAPNSAFERSFRHRRDAIYYRTETALAEQLAEMLAKPDKLEAIAESGRQRAAEQFSPSQLTGMILSILEAYG